MRSFPVVVCGNLLLIPALFSQVGPTIRPESNGQFQEVEALHRERASIGEDREDIGAGVRIRSAAVIGERGR